MSYILSMALAALMAFTGHTLAFGAETGFEYIAVGADGNKDYAVFKLEGMISYPMAREIEEHLELIEPDRKLLFHLNSGGGSVDEGLKIIAIMRREIAAGRVVNTFVDQAEMCGSMCVPLFVQGLSRSAGTTSAFMFHGVRPFHSNIPVVSRTRDLLNIFIDAGVSETFLDNLWEIGVFDTPGEYWISAKELVEADAGVITKLLPAHRKFEPWTAPFDPQIRPR